VSTFLSSSLTCPATQSGLCGAFIPFTGFASSAVRFNGRARRAERAGPGISVSDHKTDLPKLRARIGMVFSIKGVRVDAARRYD
jgi:hypothetical protein